jgi:hypothetical protein
MKFRLSTLTISVVLLLVVGAIVISYSYTQLPLSQAALRAQLGFVQLIVSALAVVGAISWLIQSF